MARSRSQARQRLTGAQSAALHPAIAEAAHRGGADEVGLIDVGRSAGFNLDVDRVGITYSDGQVRGHPSSPVQLSSTIRGGRPVPAWPFPEIVTRIGIDVDPIDVTDEDDARWLRACVAPDDTEVLATLEAAIALAATAPPLLLRGDPLERLPDALALVPETAMPLVITTWTLSSLSLEARARFLQRLDDAATDRTVAWVSIEGVGVAPAVPTLGDRRASGHSMIAVALFAHRTLQVEVVGRCWSRGRWLSWLAGT